MAALLTSVGDAKDKLAVYLNECRRMGIKVLPPDVGESIRYFAAVGEDIRFGLGAVRNVGTNVVDSIVVARQDAAFESFHDFLTKVPVHVANKRTVESLIKAGAFDSLGSTRRALMEIHEDATEAAVEVKRKAATGAIGFDFDSLYDETEEPLPVKVPDRPEWTKKDKLAFEREMLGLYVSDHPLAGLEIALA
jgi:DNA polymerase-3 subunit alpha